MLVRVGAITTTKLHAKSLLLSRGYAIASTSQLLRNEEPFVPKNVSLVVSSTRNKPSTSSSSMRCLIHAGTPTLMPVKVIDVSRRICPFKYRQCIVIIMMNGMVGMITILPLRFSFSYSYFIFLCFS